MRRLTETDDSGNWRLKGLPWKDICTGTVLTRETSMKIYSTLCKLLEYEETGLDPKEVERMREDYLPPDKREAVDRAHREVCRELEACKKALKEQEAGCIPCREYPEGHTWKNRFLHRCMQKE